LIILAAKNSPALCAYQALRLATNHVRAADFCRRKRYCARGDHKTVLLDKSPTAGALAITSHIANYPGVDSGISGEALLDLMRDQAISYGTDYRHAHVFMTECHGDIKTVYTPDTLYKTKALVLASGALGRPPSFHGEDTYLGQGVR
jgi:thioredoxin reductase (NADPH)